MRLLCSDKNFGAARWMASVVFLACTVIVPGRSGMAYGQAITVGQTLSAVVGNRINGYRGDGGVAADAEMSSPAGIVFDSAGNLYITDSGNNVIRKVSPLGIITTIAGNGTAGESGDGGPAASAELNGPGPLAIDSSGNLYFGDNGARVRKIAAGTNIITTVAGNGTTGFGGDGGPAVNALLGGASFGITLDGAGNIYIADLNNYRIRKVTAATGIINTIAGTGTGGDSGDGGPATSAEIYPTGLAVDSAGNLYMSNFQGDHIAPGDAVREISATTGIITTVVGTGYEGDSGDGGPAIDATLFDPGGLAFDSAGNLYILDTGNNNVRKVTMATGIITTVAGNDYSGFSTGTVTSSELFGPTAAAFDGAGNLYIADSGNNVIREVNTAPVTLVFPTSNLHSGNLPMVIPLLVNTTNTTITAITTQASEGNLQEFYISNIGCPLNTPLAAGTVCDISIEFYPTYAGVRRAPLQVVTSAGNYNFGMTGLGIGSQVALSPATITTVAGSNQSGYSGDGGPAINAELDSPDGVVVDSAGNLYISDSVHSVIRKVTAATGTITTVAGALNGTLNYPAGIALDAAGNLYIADYFDQEIRKVSANTGAMTTVAGNGTQGFSGDGGPATSAELSRPTSVAVDDAGNLYIADAYNSRIREVSARTGNITTIAGDGNAGFSGDGGPATNASLNVPTGIALGSDGSLYIADTQNNRVRQLSRSGIITTIAGTGAAGRSGDNGPAIDAKLNTPSRVALDGAGDIYINDVNNSVIRRVNLSGIITTIAGNGTDGFSGDGGAATGAALGPIDIAVDGIGNLYISSGPSGPTVGQNNSRVREVNVTDSTLNFVTTPLGTTSPDSPQTATVTDIGNQSIPGDGLFGVEYAGLDFYPGNSGQDPVISINFTSPSNSTSGTCQQYANSFAYLPPGDSCTIPINYSPTVGDISSGTATIVDSAGNADQQVPARQIVHLNVVGTPPGGGGGGQIGDFAIAATPGSDAVTQGASATYTISVTGSGGFTGPVALAVTGLPAGTTASFAPAAATISGTAASSSTLTITTTQTHVQLMPANKYGSGGTTSLRFALLLMPLPLLVLGKLRRRLRGVMLTVLCLVSLGAMATGLSGCANIGLEAAPQTYTLTVTGTSGSLQHSVNVTLTIVNYVRVK